MKTIHACSGARPRNLAFAHRFAGRCTRAGFLRRMAAVVLGGIGMTGTCNRVSEASESCLRGARRKRQGRIVTRRNGASVKRWDIITIGNLSRNRYWGESDAKGVRSAICTCTLIEGEGFRLLVDPSLASAEEMAKELDRRCGLKLRDIDTVFITHEHGDHWYGLLPFPRGSMAGGPGGRGGIEQDGKTRPNVSSQPVAGFARPSRQFATPGHTLSHHSLRFDCDGQSVAVAGDAVATRDFWRERRGYFNCVDFDSLGPFDGSAELHGRHHRARTRQLFRQPGCRSPAPGNRKLRIAAQANPNRKGIL